MIFACVVAAIVLAVLGAAVLLHHGHAHMDDSPYTSLAKTEGCPFRTYRVGHICPVKFVPWPSHMGQLSVLHMVVAANFGTSAF